MTIYQLPSSIIYVKRKHQRSIFLPSLLFIKFENVLKLADFFGKAKNQNSQKLSKFDLATSLNKNCRSMQSNLFWKFTIISAWNSQLCWIMCSIKIKICYIFIAGGTLGLFTGMSLLSMVEIVFWMTKMLVAACKRMVIRSVPLSDSYARGKLYPWDV